MYKNQSKIYKYHVNNLKEIELGINHIKRLIRAEIASKDPQNSVKSLLRLYAFLIGAWAETRLKKLINEKVIIDTNKYEVFEGKKPAKLYKFNKNVKKENAI